MEVYKENEDNFNDLYVYTIKQTARRLDVTEKTIRNYIKSNKLRAKKKPTKHAKQGQWFLHKHDVEDLLDGAKITEVIDLAEAKKEIPVNKLQAALNRSVSRETQKVIAYLQQKNHEVKELKDQNKQLKQEVGEMRQLINQIANNQSKIIKNQERDIEIANKLKTKLEEKQKEQENKGFFARLFGK